MIDAGRDWAAKMIRGTGSITDKGALLRLAAEFDRSNHTVRKYRPQVEERVKAYERDVLALGHRTASGGDQGQRKILNTYVARVKHKGKQRLARVASYTLEGYGTSLADPLLAGKDVFFQNWIHEDVSDLAIARHTSDYGAVPVVDAVDLVVREGSGKTVLARGNDRSLDHWLGYGDDHELWPEI